METDTLRKCLVELDVLDDALKDIEDASEFMQYVDLNALLGDRKAVSAQAIKALRAIETLRRLLQDQ